MHNKKKNQSKLTQKDTSIELVDKGIKSVIIMIFHMFKKLVEKLNMLHKDMEHIKKTKTEISEMKSLLI